MTIFLQRCRQSGCKTLTRDTYCLEHQRPSAGKRGYDSKWTRLAKQVLEEEPLCAYCGRPSKLAHHIVPKAEGGTDVRENLVGACVRCHNRLHKKNVG